MRSERHCGPGMFERSGSMGSHSRASEAAHGWRAEHPSPALAILSPVLAICMAAMSSVPAAGQSAQGAAASASVLDRVVAVVNNQAILSSELDEEMRLSVLDAGRGSAASPTPAEALDRLISRTLIQQQMRQEDVRSAAPSVEEIDLRIAEIRKELPACVQSDCGSDKGWAAFLADNGLTLIGVQGYLRNRMEILRFIEQRFRQGIRASPEEVEDYYRKTLLPQYAAGAQIPSLQAVSTRIEEILLEQKVSSLFDDWLMNLRRQGEIEVLDPALESPAPPAAGGKGRP